MFNIKTIYILASIVFLFIGCKESTKVEDSSSSTRNNTTSDPNLGHETANIQDYFYDFDSYVNANFVYFNDIAFYEGYGSSTLSTPANEMDAEDTLNFRTFPELLLDLTPDSLELKATLYPLDERSSATKESGSWCDQLMINTNCNNGIDLNGDNTFDESELQSSAFQDTTFSTSWTNLDFLEWKCDEETIGENCRYRVGLSEPFNLDSTRFYTPTTDQYVSLTYIGIIDTFYNTDYKPITNLMFVDRSEWEMFERTFLNPIVTHELSVTFNYQKQVMGLDSLIFRINGDCNRDGDYDGHELYEDWGTDWCPDRWEDGGGECNATILGVPCNCNKVDIDGLRDDNIDWDGSDPNGDNWSDCGWDALCAGDPNYTGADFNNTEGNGQWDNNEGLEKNEQYDFYEYFVDSPNGIIDPQEFYYDADISGDFSFGDPFEDRNCNGEWDDQEISDVGNGIWDADESYSLDTNGDTLLYSIGEKPVNFLVDYAEEYTASCDYTNIYDKCPRPFSKFAYTELDTGKTDTIVTFTHYDGSGNPQFETYDSLVIKKAISVPQMVVYPDIDSVVTVYTNVIIDSLSVGVASDYHITKAQWYEPYGITTNLVTATYDTLRNYDFDYHIFRNLDDGNIVKMVHPQFFNHYGYFTNFSTQKSGLWKDLKTFVEDVYIYTYGGQLRAEEYHFEENHFIKELGEYRVETEFEVEFCDGDGIKDDYCSIDDNGKSIDGYGKDEEIIVPISADSILTNVFKIIRTRTVIMIGNGVEFGTRNTIWLGKDLGIVKDKLEMRWSEGFWLTDDMGESQEIWKEFSRLELKTLRSQNVGLMRKIMDPIKQININEFSNEQLLNYDAYQMNPTFGIHRIRFTDE